MANRKNNHYHYAEQYQRKGRHARPTAKLPIPRRTALVTVLFLLIFGVISTTFASYVTSSAPSDPGSIIIDVRTAKAAKDVATTGANVNIAETSWSMSGVVYYLNTDSWSDPYLYVWQDGGGNSNIDMNYISGTGIYYYSGGWNNYSGFKFHDGSSTWTNQSSANITGDATSKVYQGSSTSSSARTILNGNIKIHTMISFNGGTSYTESASSSIYTTLSTKALSSGGTSLPTSASTYSTSASSATATGSTAYGYQYSVTPHAGSYATYMGMSTSNSGPGTNKDNPYKDYSTEKNTTKDLYFYYRANYITPYAISPTSPYRIAATTVKPTATYSTTSSNDYSYATLTAPSISGYVFDHWGFSAGTQTYYSSSYTSKTNPTRVRSSVNSNATAYYKLKEPNKPYFNVTGPLSYTIGTTSALDLKPVATTEAKASGATVTITTNKSYTITDSSGNAVTDANVASVTSAGKFDAKVPGQYTVTVTSWNTDNNGGTSVVTDDAGNVTGGTKTSDALTVNVYPPVPDIKLTVSGYTAGTGTEEDPFMISLGADYSFKAEVTSTTATGYTYTWYQKNSDETSTKLGTGKELTFGAARASAATTADVHLQVYCVVSYTGTDLTSTSGTVGKYYYIKSLIDTFELNPFQKIYTSPNDASITVSYNLSDSEATAYTTTLWFSPDNHTYYEADKKPNALIKLFDNVLTDYMYRSGVKYFYLNVSKNDNTATANTKVVHTTVGTDQSVGTRPFYFINSAGLSMTDSRVTAFYTVDGEMKYQTAVDMFADDSDKDETRYRVYLPANATKLSFAVAKVGKYGVPSYDGSFSYPDGTADTFFLAYTGDIDIDSAKNTVEATAKTLVGSHTAEDDPFYSLTTTYSAYH